MRGMFVASPVKSKLLSAVVFLILPKSLELDASTRAERAVKHKNGGKRVAKTAGLAHSDIGASAVLIWWCPK